ncbi:MAG: DUF4385 family protein [Kofleriaceae bacterium]|nr:DUF4385 family protein [Kofleriaceae bacterium]
MSVDLEDKILALLAQRRPGASICPSEVARAVRPHGAWRALLPAVRDAAAILARRGAVELRQRGRRVSPRGYKGPVRIVRAHKADHAAAYRGIDFRAHPERYRVGRGEQGVLLAEPYKSELLPLWRFRTPELARASVSALWKKFVAYRAAGDGVGMDMARKFLQMGFTRARRYANRRSGVKYRGSATPPDSTKAKCASIFFAAWKRVERDRTYRAWRARARRLVRSP